MKYLVLFLFLPAMAFAQTVQQPPPPALASQQSIARANADRESVETAVRHYEESIGLHDQNRQNEIAALTKENKALADKNAWWVDCTSERIAGCREWILSFSTPVAPTAEAK